MELADGGGDGGCSVWSVDRLEQTGAVEGEVCGGCSVYGVLTDWGKLEQLRGGSVVEGDLEGIVEVTIGVADTIFASSLQPLEGKLVMFTDGGLDHGVLWVLEVQQVSMQR